MHYITNLKGQIHSPLIAILILLFLITPLRSQEAQKDFDDTPKIVVFGDSLVAGYQLPPGKSFPERLQEALDAKGISVKIIAAGVSGDTTSAGLARLDWSIPDGIDGVLLELGANDALRGLPPKNTSENLKLMIEKLTERGIKVMLLGILAPPNMGEDYASEFNPIYAKLADQYELKLYPFFLDGVLTHADKLLADGKHPNVAGVEVMVGKIIPMVEQFIEDLRPSP